AGFDNDCDPRRLCRRRREGQGVPAGRHRRRHGLHGRARSGAFPRRGGRRRDPEGGGIAGEALNLSQSAVSRQISALEESLSVPLFHRHARGLILTEQGDLLYRTAREVFAKLAMTEAMLTESKDRPKGPLKVTTTVAFGSAWLTPRIREFL